eukprot:100-Heterococcus_DN1.PRE.1
MCVYSVAAEHFDSMHSVRICSSSAAVAEKRLCVRAAAVYSSVMPQIACRKAAILCQHLLFVCIRLTLYNTCDVTRVLDDFQQFNLCLRFTSLVASLSIVCEHSTQQGLTVAS